MISEKIILRLKNKGSRNAENNAPVERVLNATATFETLIAPKKVIQCVPIIAPIPNSINKSFREIFKLIPEIRIKTYSVTAQINVLYQTKGIAETSMSFPKTPVKPHKKTIS